MSDFAGMEEMLADFLTEGSDMLSGVDNKLVELERRPGDRGLLNDIFRGFHTIKGGAGFLNAAELVALCHLTENLFDRLRNGELEMRPEIMDVILAATAEVRRMFDELSGSRQPGAAPPVLLDSLRAASKGEPVAATVAAPVPAAATGGEPDWSKFYEALVRPGAAQPGVPAAAPATAAPATAAPRAPAAPSGHAPAAPRESTIRVETERLDSVLTLSGELGLTRNRLSSLRSELLEGRSGEATLRSLDEAVSQLALLVGNLQSAVMRTRMQPIDRLFRKFPRLARDLARSLGKDVELELSGGDTEIDKTMIEDLNDPLVHLVRNAVDHGVEGPEDRGAAGKPPQSRVRLGARQEGDHIIIEIADDGRGMRVDAIRGKAIEKGLVSAEEANGMDDRQAINLIFLPGFSTKTEISDVSGRGVGMDVVKTNIEKLNGTVQVETEFGRGSKFTISLPLTLAILQVLLVRLGDQPFAVPLSLVREILPLSPDDLCLVGGQPSMIVRGEVLPVIPLASLVGWPAGEPCAYGVLMQAGGLAFVLGIDAFLGREDVMIKPIDGFKPRGVAGVTVSSEGEIVLILDFAELQSAPGGLRAHERRCAA